MAGGRTGQPPGTSAGGGGQGVVQVCPVFRHLIFFLCQQHSTALILSKTYPTHPLPAACLPKPHILPLPAGSTPFPSPTGTPLTPHPDAYLQHVFSSLIALFRQQHVPLLLINGVVHILGQRQRQLGRL